MVLTLQELLGNQFVYTKDVFIVELLVWLLWSCRFGLALYAGTLRRGHRPRARERTHTIQIPYHRFHANFLKEER